MVRSFHIKNSRGFSMTELMVGVGILSVVLLIIGSVITNVSNLNNQAGSVISLEDLRRSTLEHLKNEQWWQSTLKNPANVNFNCVNAQTDCSGAAGSGEFLLFDTSGIREPHLSLTVEANIGLTPQGVACSTFSALGNDLCPFKYVARWTAICPAAQNIQGKANIADLCRNPLIDITVNMIFSPANAGKFPPLNLANLQLHLTKSQTESDPQKLCDMIQGVFNPVSKTCLAAAPTNCIAACPPGGPMPMVSGFNVDGSPICQCSPWVRQECRSVAGPPDTVLKGVNPDGSLNCGKGEVFILQSTGGWLLPPVTGT